MDGGRRRVEEEDPLEYIVGERSHEEEGAAEDVSAAVSAATTLPRAESDLLMPHASSSRGPLAPLRDTFSHPAEF